jgi:hypothetical protein
MSQTQIWAACRPGAKFTKSHQKYYLIRELQKIIETFKKLLKRIKTSSRAGTVITISLQSYKYLVITTMMKVNTGDLNMT